jgi:iron complex outermembrane recepter protein
MKKIFVFILSISISFSAFAASTSIKGTVVDAGTQTPLDFVNVALFKEGSQKPVSGVFSDKNGIFIIPSVAEGKYSIRVSFVGYSTVKQDVNLTGKPLNLGLIKLEENSKKLGEVEVVGQGTQMRFDVDKKIYSVDQSIATAGGSASDVLKNIPSVKVDNEGNVSLRKDANVEVWINGKPSGLNADNRAQILQQMPAESIESIEVMTNPSAKFNPEGTAGIINLVLKKNRKAGYYGSVSTGVMYPDGGGVRPTFGANINYSSSKIDAYANVGYRAMKFKGGSKTDRYNLNGTDTTSLFSQNGTMTNEFRGLFARAGVDFHLDTLITIGISGFGMAGSGNSSNYIDYLLTDRSINPGAILQKYSRDNVGSGTRPSLNVNLDFKRDFSKVSNLMASLSYSTHSRGGDNEIVQKDSSNTIDQNFTQNTLGTNKEFGFKADYTNKFSETSRLEAGWQSTVSNRFSSSSAHDNLLNQDISLYMNDFDYNEQIHAAYVTYGDRFDKFSVQGGLRSEYFRRHSTNTSANGVISIPAKSDLQLFPSLYLSYSLPQNNELQLNYTRRVNRPRGRQINPFIDYSNSGTISYGNPNLLPEYASAFELNYIKTWENHSFSTTAYYRFTDNGIEDVRFKNGNVMENTYMNLSKRQSSGLELVAKNRVFKVVNLTSTLNLYYSKINSSVYINPYDSTLSTTIPAQNNFSWSANVMANFMLSKTLSGQITAEYSAPTLIAQGIESPEYQVDLGLRKTFFDRKLTIGLMAMDIFNFNKERTITWGTGFYQKEESYFHRRMLGLTVTYNFGNMKPKQTDMKKKQGSGDMNMDSME